MSGSNIKLTDFKAKNNSLFENYESKMDELQERLNKLESTCFSIKEQTSALLLQKEGGNESKMNKFEELLEKYNKTVEDITFEYSNLSDEELEVKFKEVFEDSSIGKGRHLVTVKITKDRDLKNLFVHMKFHMKMFDTHCIIY